MSNAHISVSMQVTAETQELMERAAELSGRSLQQFLVDAVTKEAKSAIDLACSIRVSPAGADMMMHRLDNPRPISPALRRAAIRYRDTFHNPDENA